MCKRKTVEKESSDKCVNRKSHMQMSESCANKKECAKRVNLAEKNQVVLNKSCVHKKNQMQINESCATKSII